MVDTVEQARTAIAAAKYPPIGNRSLGGGLQMLNFDATSGDYFRQANDEILVVLQTESPRGIENAEAIYSLPGVDAIFVGPVDLRANLCSPDGVPADDAALEAAIARVVATGKKTGTPTGMHTMSPDAALARAAQGMQFIAVGSELRMMTSEAQAVIALCGLKGTARDIARY